MSGYLPYLRDESIYIKEFYSVQHVYMPENHLSGRECYDFWELVYVMDGELNTNAGNAFYVLPKGSLILYEPLEFHTLDVREHQFADLFIMSFSITGPAAGKLKQLPFSLDATQQADMDRIIQLCTDGVSAEPYFFRPDSNATSITYHQTFLERPLFLPKLCALTEFLLLCLCDTSTSKIPSVNNYETMMFLALTEDMKHYKDQLLTIEELADLHNISPTNAKTLIKKYSGLSLHKYYLGIKISQALVLFRQGCNISQVSQELGFCNTNYFSSVFKKYTGDTPSQYLRKLKEVV